MGVAGGLVRAIADLPPWRIDHGQTVSLIVGGGLAHAGRRAHPSAHMGARWRVFWLVAWAIAFGIVEGAVVTYLRRLFYARAPLDGPLFPLRIAEPAVLATEVAREAATLVMLGAMAMLSERRPARRFAAFALGFGLWDLAYYGLLKTAIGWPHGLLEWDILFLIPGPWASPVLAPVLVSAALVAGALLILLHTDETRPSPLRGRDWWVLCACGLPILASFFWNTGRIARSEMPGRYPWWLFLVGWLAGVAWFAWVWWNGRARGGERRR
jgi:hypothetical protein